MGLKLGIALPVAAATAGLVLCSTMVLRTSQALFSATTDAPGNSWQTGTVALSDDDSGTALFSTATDGNLTGGQQLQKCVTVTYAGTLITNASVKLYSTASGDLAPYLNLVVDRGTSAGAGGGSCAGFNATHVAVYNGTVGGLAGTATTYDTGIAPWAPPSTGSSTVYRFTITVQNVVGAQGKSATGSFTWEAQG